MYNYIECEIEATTKAQAKKIFIEELEENEGKNFTARAMEFGRIEICEI